jgi:hypothetical protein
VEQDESAARERNKLDRFQMGKLLKQLENWADEFNARSSLGSIALESTRGEDSPFPSYLLMLPLESQIAIVFFWIDPPLNLRSGSVRFAAYVSDVQGGGFNLLLIRGNDQDMYGEWAVCKVSVSALARQDRAPSKRQPFGFSNAEDIREIERADRAMHVFENDFSDDVLEAFSLIAQEALEQ